MPQDVINQFQTRAEPLGIYDVLVDMVMVAVSIREVLRDDDQKWYPFEIAGDIVVALLDSEYPVVETSCASEDPVLRAREYRQGHNVAVSVPTEAAHVLGTTLWGDNSTLWHLLVYMCGVANQGSKFVQVVGPVGSGKSLTMIAFAALQFLVSETSSAIVCSSNLPLDDTTMSAHKILDGVGKVVRATAVSWARDMLPADPADYLPWQKAVSTPQHIPEITSKTLLVATLSLASLTFRGEPVLPRGCAHVAFHDEVQNSKQMMASNLLHEDGQFVAVADKEPTKQRVFGESWNSPFGEAAPIHDVLRGWESIIASGGCASTDNNAGSRTKLLASSSDMATVAVITHPRLQRTLTQAQSFGMEPVDVPALLFTQCHRLRPEALHDLHIAKLKAQRRRDKVAWLCITSPRCPWMPAVVRERTGTFLA